MKAAVCWILLGGALLAANVLAGTAEAASLPGMSRSSETPLTPSGFREALASKGKSLSTYGWQAEEACTLRDGYEEDLGWKLFGAFLTMNLRKFANTYTALYRLERLRTAKVMRIGPPQHKKKLARRWVQARRDLVERYGELVAGINDRYQARVGFRPTVRWLMRSSTRARYDSARRENNRLARSLLAPECAWDD